LLPFKLALIPTKTFDLQSWRHLVIDVLTPRKVDQKRMGRLLLSCADYRATSARRRTTAHPTVVRRLLCSGYVLSKKDSCELMKGILIPYQKYDITKRLLVPDN
jgi:hypothetical protein